VQRHPQMPRKANSPKLQNAACAASRASPKMRAASNRQEISAGYAKGIEGASGQLQKPKSIWRPLEPSHAELLHLCVHVFVFLA
jgi:hypothetical protein